MKMNFFRNLFLDFQLQNYLKSRQFLFVALLCKSIHISKKQNFEDLSIIGVVNFFITAKF